MIRSLDVTISTSVNPPSTSLLLPHIYIYDRTSFNCQCIIIAIFFQNADNCKVCYLYVHTCTYFAQMQYTIHVRMLDCILVQLKKLVWSYVIIIDFIPFPVIF